MTKVKMLLVAALMASGAAMLPAGATQAAETGVGAGYGPIAVQYDSYRGRGWLSVRPGEAEPGDRVTVIGRGLPPGARMVLAVGRSPSRLERVQMVRSDMAGRVFARAIVPEWARPGRPVFFALQIPRLGRTLALSRPVRVIDSGEDNGQDDGGDTVTVTGELLEPTATCPRLAGDDGRIYALAGSLRQFDTGDRVRVTGELADVSTCNSRRTIDIERIRDAE